VFSELVFLNEGPVDQITTWDGDVPFVLFEFVLIYAGFAYVTLVAMWSFGIRGWQSLALAGALMGWLIEGVVIPLMYEAPPLSFFWPSLGWHMIFSFWVAWFGIPMVMQRLNAWTQVAVYLAAGVAWAAWGRVFFAEDPAMTLPEPWSFAGLVALAGCVLIPARWLADRVWARFVPNRWDIALATLLSVPLALATGISSGPAAGIAFALVAVTLWAMARHGSGTCQGPETPPEPLAYLRLAMFPLGAALAMPLIPEAPAGWSFVVTLPLTLIATTAWAVAVLGALFRRHPGRR